jgi:hypothetical protein
VGEGGAKVGVAEQVTWLTYEVCRLDLLSMQLAFTEEDALHA